MRSCRHEQDIEADRGRYAGIHNRDVGKVSVAQAMNKAVIVMDIDSDIPAIAREMVSRDAGSVIITENDKAMGIITERDLVKGIVTENRKPDEVRAEDILSSPLITIEPEKSIAEASEIMLKANIKRLPVLEDRTVIGIISNTDILMVTPGLSTILKDLIDMNREALLSVPSIEEISESEDFPSGICESCNTFSYDLRLVNGQYLCGRCREEVGENYE
jgi:CBS domain-containing protein